MPNLKWIKESYKDIKKSDDAKVEFIRFMNDFYSFLDKEYICENKSKTKSSQYKEEVFDMLMDRKKNFPLSEAELVYLQHQVEALTLNFNEESMFKSVPNIIQLLIKIDGKCAKDVLRDKLSKMEDIELISLFGHYTIEALIVYELSCLFNSVENTSMIRLATLVERLEKSVRTQAYLLKSRRYKWHNTIHTNDSKSQNEEDKSQIDNKYTIGSCLIDFMIDRNLIQLISNSGENVRVSKKKKSYYIPSHLYVICNFDISLLPIKFNLPMVCKPVDWKSTCPNGEIPRSLSDLTGGYLSGLTGDIYDRYRLLSSGNLNHFYIHIGSGEELDYQNLCGVMNTLQRQAFQINSNWLKYLLDNEKLFVENGLLKPRFLSSLNIQSISNLLREFYMKDDVIKRFCSFSEILNHLCKDIQCSRYEDLIIKLALAYEGYHFNLPAFLDFRGRIYRSGVLHFHERDLARSMILFAGTEPIESISNDNYILLNLLAAAAFHYQNFTTNTMAIKWIHSVLSQISDNPFDYVIDAKRPFQFFANIIGILYSPIDVLKNIPITQDASASAYQIMSYFLLDECLAKRTNLIPSEDGVINDIYVFLLEELREFMKVELDKNLSAIVCKSLTRKLVKSIFMPKIYGKTLMSTANDVKDILSHYITHKECFTVASACFKFWKEKYPGMECLIRLIRHIGWIASAADRPVFYKVPYFTTVQDYMIMEPAKIWVYDRFHKKRRQVTLRVSSSKRDRMKSDISTFVNFIHQRDANIAMRVVENMQLFKKPIYTVHDNFISTAHNSNLIPSIYTNVFRNMGPPLSIINQFIYMNVIKPIQKGDSDEPLTIKVHFSNNYGCVIPKETLHYFLKRNIPKNISKKMQATWEERISGIMTSYEIYINKVCGDFKSSTKAWKVHEEKWNQFQLKILSDREKTNYSVHH